MNESIIMEVFHVYMSNTCFIGFIDICLRDSNTGSVASLLESRPSLLHRLGHDDFKLNSKF